MLQAFELGGFLAAHAVWSVSDGQVPLVPLFAHRAEAGEKKMERLVTTSTSKSVALGREKLASSSSDAALLYHGRLSRESEATDALIIEVRSSSSPKSSALLAVPIRLPGLEPFKVFLPKILKWDDCEDFELNRAMTSFFESVDEHPEGSKVWLNALAEG